MNEEIEDLLTNFYNIVADELSNTNTTRGKKLYKISKNYISLSAIDLPKSIELFVPSVTNNTDFYNVVFNFTKFSDLDFEQEYLDNEELEIYTCTCKAFEQQYECKHISAALEYMNDNLDHIIEENNDFKNRSIVTQKNITNKINNSLQKIKFSLDGISRFKNNICNIFNIEQYTWGKKNLKINKLISPQKIEATYFEKEKTHHVTLFHDGKLNFEFSCDCNLNKPCVHLKDTVKDIINNNSDWIINNYNFEIEKKEIAKKIEVEITDPIIAEYTFKLDNYSNLIITPPKNFHTNINAQKRNIDALLARKKFAQTVSNTSFNIGLLFHFNVPTKFDLLSLEFLNMKLNESGQVIKADIAGEKLMYTQVKHLVSDQVFENIEKLTHYRLYKYYENAILQKYGFEYNFPSRVNEEESVVLREYVFNTLKDIWPQLEQMNHVYLLKEFNKIAFKYYEKISLSLQSYSISFEINDTESIIKLLPKIHLPDIEIKAENVLENFSGFILYNNTIFIPKTFEEFQMIHSFGVTTNYFPKALKQNFQDSILKPLMQKFDVVVNNTVIEKIEIRAEAKPRILFSDVDGNLVLQPQMQYEDIVTDLDNEELKEITLTEIKIYHRDEIAEQNLISQIKQLHPIFENQNNAIFTIDFASARKDLWFVKTIEKLKELSIEVFGTNNFKFFKVSSHRAKMKLSASSGIDWFDVKMEVSFGEEIISLSQIKKAIATGNMTIPLKDGSLGLLPTEWAKKYGILLNVSKLKNNDIQVSKLHYTLIDAMADEIDDDALLAELEEKKRRLANIDKVKTKPLSKKITATLRPYQEHSLGWLQVLDEMGWGACLADDMGLGKTLQSISFLQFVKEKYKGRTSLIICPTSLIYNWQAELEKFAPSMSFNVHYGIGRNVIETYFGKVDLIITTYGMLRSDIEDFVKLKWQYVILDESQAIKNPIALTTKATQLLVAHNRIILSGTPLQNNTMDLYAQFQFLNPGLLGNIDYFKDTFSNPIDKNNDAEAAQQLKQLIYPFLLRRTKEQVAKDLPEKTETILWCEMDKKQRKVYDEYKEYYKQLLLKKIDEMGMAKAGIYVIEGLLRLRQICDSPLLVKNEKVAITNSVKIEELIRELTENTGNNKVLVFSQFVEMLKLIEDELVKHNINFVVLTGSTPAAKRREYVQQFQEDETTKVFLMSIKAGGVGLNLTKANYVYIVDPWWNPAVEQQAIDRTHRIGQTQQIFAYKMICKDTVEEKIVQLQKKKKQLTDDLITEDAGFIKKLSRDDVAFLFG